MMIPIAAAPGTTRIGQSAPTPTTGCGLPEAVILTCALAGWGNPLSGTDAHAAYLRSVIVRVRNDYTIDEILRWDQRDNMTATECRYRWVWARSAIQCHFPDADGVEDVPLLLDDAALIDVSTGVPTARPASPPQ